MQFAGAPLANISINSFKIRSVFRVLVYFQLADFTMLCHCVESQCILTDEKAEMRNIRHGNTLKKTIIYAINGKLNIRDVERRAHIFIRNLLRDVRCATRSHAFDSVGGIVDLLDFYYPRWLRC